MINYWFTADWHLWHPNIIRHCNQPFGSDEEKRGVVRDNINAVAGPNDRLVIIGDLALKCTVNRFAAWLDELVVKNLDLVYGNHDSLVRKLVSRQPSRFNQVGDRLIYDINGVIVHCDHYAHRVWYQSHRGSYHLYGHSHGNLPGYGRSMDVGVDTNNFKPYSFAEINDRLSTVPYPALNDRNHARRQ